MSIDQIIEQKINEQVSIALSSHLEEITDLIASKLSKPEYKSWGRFLSSKQAMAYTGFRSLNGFKEMCRIKGVEAIKINERVLRYDREELDKIKLKNELLTYLEKIN